MFFKTRRSRTSRISVDDCCIYDRRWCHVRIVFRQDLRVYYSFQVLKKNLKTLRVHFFLTLLKPYHGHYYNFLLLLLCPNLLWQILKQKRIHLLFIIFFFVKKTNCNWKKTEYFPIYENFQPYFNKKNYFTYKFRQTNLSSFIMKILVWSSFYVLVFFLFIYLIFS